MGLEPFQVILACLIYVRQPILAESLHNVVVDGPIFFGFGPEEGGVGEAGLFDRVEESGYLDGSASGKVGDVEALPGVTIAHPISDHTVLAWKDARDQGGMGRVGHTGKDRLTVFGLHTLLDESTDIGEFEVCVIHMVRGETVDRDQDHP